MSEKESLSGTSPVFNHPGTRNQRHGLPVPGFHLILLSAELTELMDKSFMSRAIQLSIENVQTGKGGPFGAVIVKGKSIVAEGVNRVTQTNDPTAHAEVNAIRAACAALKTFELKGCDLYTSCEPCPMCLGAIYWARLDRVYYAGLAADAAEAGFDDSFIYREIAQHHPERAIPMVQMMREEALAGFRTWQQSGNKIPY